MMGDVVTRCRKRADQCLRTEIVVNLPKQQLAPSFHHPCVFDPAGITLLMLETLSLAELERRELRLTLLQLRIDVRFQVLRAFRRVARDNEARPLVIVPWRNLEDVEALILPMRRNHQIGLLDAVRMESAHGLM